MFGSKVSTSTPTDSIYHANQLFGAAMATQGLFFTGFGHLVSVCISLDMVRRGYIKSNKNLIIGLSVTELLLIVISIACAFLLHCKDDEETKCKSYGWIGGIVWFVGSIVLGFIRAFKLKPFDGISTPEPIVV